MPDPLFFGLRMEVEDMLGFSFNGRHCEELHVHFIPKESQRGNIMSDYEVLDDERSWFAGGDYYRSRVKSRQFELPCYYEDVSRKELEDIVKWLDRREQGYLIFDDRPFARYYVHPTKRIEPKNYGIEYGLARRYSGTFTVTFTAYYPFADLLYTNEEDAPIEALNEVDLLPEDLMPATDVKSLSEFVVYNPGTELGQSFIEFAGTTGAANGDNLVITNVTNGDKCIIRAGTTTDTGKHYEIDSKKGRMELVSTTGRILDYVPHGAGYIHFEPNVILADNILITQTSGSRVLTSHYAFKPEYVGAYIYIDGGWKYLGTYTSEAEMQMNVNASSTKTVRTKIVTMNRLTITKDANASISTLNVYCRPEVR